MEHDMPTPPPAWLETAEGTSFAAPIYSTEPGPVSHLNLTLFDATLTSRPTLSGHLLNPHSLSSTSEKKRRRSEGDMYV